VLVLTESLLVGFQALLVRTRWVASAAWLYAERLLETSALPTPAALPTGPTPGPAMQ
jgi:hypothetical protein